MKLDQMSADDIVNEIMGQLTGYSEEVDEIMQDEIDKVSKDVKKSLSTNPVIPERTGAYKKSFRIKKVAQGSGYKRNVIYNILHQLTHLLENGHLTRAGTRTRKFPHWKQAQEIAEQLPERVEKRLETGD
jgi:hypothetical protein